MGLSRDQAYSRALTLGQCIDAGADIETELSQQLRGVRRIPSRIERLRVAQQLGDAHPAGQIGLFGEVADASQHRGRFRYRIQAEHSHRTGFRPPQPEQMFDQRGLTGPVFANETEHASS